MTGIGDALKNAIIFVLIGACVILSGLSGLFLYRMRLAVVGQQAAEARVEGLTDQINRNKVQAAAELRTANASVLAQQTRLDAIYLQQEKQSVLDQKVAGDAGDQLRRFRADSRLRADAAKGPGSGRGGAAQQATADASADPGAADRASRAGLLREAAIAEGDDDARLADRINVAYRSCRADAFNVRKVMNLIALDDGTWFESVLDPPVQVAAAQ
ncbi:hypothetical protein D3C85_557790 [compost metagenome]